MMFRRQFLATLFAAPLLARAATTDLQPLEAGTDYLRVAVPQRTESGNKIEVVEFFWYGCPHCNQLQPGLDKWKKTLPKDAVLRLVPAVFAPNWEPGARIFYALQDLGLLDRFHNKVFAAYHQDALDLNNPVVLKAWLTRNRIDVDRFMAAYNGFSTGPRVASGAQLARGYGVKGVPSLGVDGRYLTAQSMTITEERLFETVDTLIELSRRNRSKK
jgi:thiol:disulfide interchange protein DsbA